MEITKQETISLGLRSCGLKLLHTQADTCTYIIIAQLCILGVGIFVLYSFFPLPRCVICNLRPELTKYKSSSSLNL